MCITQFWIFPPTFTSREFEIVVSLDENALFGGVMYSFDGGTTWQKQNSIKISENKLLNIMIKNKLGLLSNEIKYEVDKIEQIVLLN